MLRVLVLFLLLANLAFFVWAQGWLRVLELGPSTQSEPFRLSQQIRPEALRVMPDVPTGQPAPAADPVGAPVSAGQ
jgi:hypothetical protein